jgi:NAD(P)-dependent dehydrogenase (short-subunit alcohol dehydrogenase family)
MNGTSSIVIVTGAAGNLGRALLTVLASRGVTLVAVDHHAAALKEATAGLRIADGHLTIAGLDLKNPSDCEQVISTALDRFERIDGVAHTVGGFEAAPAAESGPDLFERMFQLNAVTTLNMFRAALPSMRAAGSGSLVAVGAWPALRAPPGLSAYAAAKSAVLRLVESFADELKKENIRVNAVLPGIIDTPQNRAAMPHADVVTWVRPEQIATAIAFLLSEDASAVTGAALPVRGAG